MKCRHMPDPIGYLSWQDWAKKKALFYEQVLCPKCGLYKIWVRKKVAA